MIQKVLCIENTVWVSISFQANCCKSIRLTNSNPNRPFIVNGLKLPPLFTIYTGSSNRLFLLIFLLNCYDRSNFLGTKFTVYDAQPLSGGALATKCRSFRPGSMKRVSPRVPAGNYPVSHISYELNVLGSRYDTDPKRFTIQEHNVWISNRETNTHTFCCLVLIIIMETILLQQ